MVWRKNEKQVAFENRPGKQVTKQEKVIKYLGPNSQHIFTALNHRHIILFIGIFILPAVSSCLENVEKLGIWFEKYRRKLTGGMLTGERLSARMAKAEENPNA